MSGSERDPGKRRETILARVRDALGERPPVEHPGPLPFPDPGADPVEAFAARFRSTGGEVVELAGLDAVQAWLRAFAAEFETLSAAYGLPSAFRPPLPDAVPREAGVGVSMALWAAADTGSLLLPSDQGRGGQLLPSVHLVWVERDRVLPTLAEALESAAREGLPTVLALHSGPSKSADIGRILVTGIHGPGRVVAAVVET